MAAAAYERAHGINVEQAGFVTARNELLRLARKRCYAALATSTPDGMPEVAPLRYAVTDDFHLVMGTLRTSRKYANLLRNSNTAIVIWDEEFSLQIEGTFDEPIGADLENLQSLFAAEFPKEARLRASRPNHTFFRITPTWARYSDFSDEPPHVLTLDFTNETETRQTWPVTSTE